MGGRSAILTYHSLDDSGSVISTSPDVFRRQIEYLANSGIPVVPLARVPESPGAVAISFDDGFCNVAKHAFPLLERFNLPATIFVVSRYCGGENNWPSQPSGAVPNLPLLSWEALKEMPNGLSIGAHTSTHPDLCKLSLDECEREFQECRDEIEQRIARSVRCLAYPYGNSSPQIRGVAKRHFDLAVGTSLRFLSTGSDRLDLPRIDTYYLRGSFPMERLFTSLGGFYVGVRHSLRQARRFTR